MQDGSEDSAEQEGLADDLDDDHRNAQAGGQVMIVIIADVSVLDNPKGNPPTRTYYIEASTLVANYGTFGSHISILHDDNTQEAFVFSHIEKDAEGELVAWHYAPPTGTAVVTELVVLND
jgi:hypothetical protein